MFKRLAAIAASALLLAAPAAASLTPAQVASAFTKEYNGEHTPYRILSMTCWRSKVDPRSYFDCYLKIARRDGQSKPMCGVIVTDTAFDVLENHIVRCVTKTPTHTTKF